MNRINMKRKKLKMNRKKLKMNNNNKRKGQTIKIINENEEYKNIRIIL